MFDAPALAVVIACSWQMAQTIGLPAMPPEGTRFEPQAGKITLLYGVHGQPVSVQHGPLSALLIAYCMRAGIRIPRKLERSLRVDRGSVALVFEENHSVPPIRLAPERPGVAEPSRSMSWLEPAPRDRRHNR